MSSHSGLITFQSIADRHSCTSVVAAVMVTDLIHTCGVSEVDGLPAVHECSQGQVHVLNCGPALPATNCDNGLAAPNASCAVEVEEATSSKLNVLLTFAVKV